MGVKKWLNRRDFNASPGASAYEPRAALVSSVNNGHMRAPTVIDNDGVVHRSSDAVRTGSPDVLSASVADAFVSRPDTYKSLPRGVEPGRSPRSRFFDPLSLMYATGFKDRRHSVSFDTLRNVSYQLSVVGAIIKARVNQVSSFAQPYRENRQVGFQLKFKDEHHVTTEEEKQSISRLERMIMECGFGKNRFSSLPRDNFKMFLRKIIRDSMTYDQATFEIIPDKQGRPFEFRAIDASTIRLAATFDGHRGQAPRTFNADYFADKWKKTYGDDFEFDTTGVHTVQVLHGRIENIFTYNDLAFCIRNGRTDIWSNGYGFSELEQGLNTVLSMIWAEEYNRRAFSQGSHPKGILNIKGENISPENIEAFKRQWYANMVGVENSWKTPILQADEMQYQNLQNTNREMEFNLWLDYLRKTLCSVYDIDPTEIGFDGSGGGVTGQQPMFESKKEWKIKHSKDRGLRPLLKDVAEWMTEYIVDPLDSRLYFDFVGLDELSEVDRIELQTKKSSTFMTINEVREEEGLNPLMGGDTINSGIFIQSKQMEVANQGPTPESELAPWHTAGDGPPPEYGSAPPVPLWLQGNVKPSNAGGAPQ